ncbi:MAG TPA: cyclic peptide export ABC transporter [Ignavibacteriales bacterium]|nr:cyclic peptide export ABC transporter [Ignavibacteriales bacterium]
MKFYQFLRKESDKPLLKLFFLTALSGLSSAGVLAIINLAAKNAAKDSLNISYILMFASTVGIFVTSQKFILTSGILVIEEILNNIRLRLSDKIRRTDLLNIEQIGKAEIYNRLTQECTLISQMAPYIITALQSAIMLLFVFGYIAILSILAAVLLVLLILAGVLVFHKNNVKVYADLEETNKAEIKFFVSLTDILNGLKEIKLNRKKSSDLFRHFEKISLRLKELKIDTGNKFSENMVFSQAFIYIILGAIVFVLPRLKPDMAGQIVSTTTAMLFAIGPLTSIVSMLPVFGKVNIAIKNIYQLEEELDQQVNPNEVQPINGENRFSDFKEILLNDLYFEYKNGDGKDSFSIGPIDLKVTRGEVIFIIGGNGCGKTTFLKSLTLLYKPKSGNIFVDDKIVDSANYLEYRELYSAIFYDFHLFDKLYGLEKVDPKRIKDLLKLMQIENKTDFIDNGFTKLDLSTGQRKRLALIVTFLEDKPIYIFDEWAADQDPQFKKYFYDDLLKKLKSEGKTVIAVSHDDRYFHLADRIIKMEYGKII